MPGEVLGSFSNDDGDANEDVKKTIGLLRKTTTLHVHHAFLYISLPSLHDYDVKMPNCKFTEDVNKRRRISFSLSKVECGPEEINSTEIRLHLPFSANWNKRDSVLKTGIHFRSDVFTAVAVVDAEAPYYFPIGLQNREVSPKTFSSRRKKEGAHGMIYRTLTIF